jgi:hypothetical protein
MKIAVSPEGIDLANEYLKCGSIEAASKSLCISVDKAVELLNKTEVKRYLDTVYMDMGYRNRDKLGALMDEIIESKLEEARESEMYSSLDLVKILELAHKMRMDEIKAMSLANGGGIKNQTNVQINDHSNKFGEGNYGKLMEQLLGGTGSKEIEV